MTDEDYLRFTVQFGYLNIDLFRNKHVGCIIIKDDRIISVGFRTMFPKYMGYKYCCWHGEGLALKSIENLDITGATLFSSMEPCTVRLVNDDRLYPSISCTQIIINSGKISRVVYAENDEWLKISGRSVLESYGIECVHIPMYVPKVEPVIPEEFKDFIEPFLERKI